MTWQYRANTLLQSSMNLTVDQGQWMADLAVQHSGDIEALFSLCRLNDLSPTLDLTPGAVLVNTAPVNPKVVTYFGAQKLKPATKDDAIVIRPGGIGFMQIGTTFRVY